MLKTAWVKRGLSPRCSPIVLLSITLDIPGSALRQEKRKKSHKNGKNQNHSYLQIFFHLENPRELNEISTITRIQYNGEKKNTRISYTKNNLQKRETGTLMGQWRISKRHGADGTWLTEKYQRALIQAGEGKHTTLNYRFRQWLPHWGSEGNGSLTCQARLHSLHGQGNNFWHNVGLPQQRADWQRSEILQWSGRLTSGWPWTMQRGLPQKQQEQELEMNEELSSGLSGTMLPSV